MNKWIVSFSLLLNWTVSNGQGFIAPAEGKAVVYFVRHSNYQMRLSFDFFDGDKLIADFHGRQYLRYECEPGKHLFWASAENRIFLPATLKENGTYIVMVESRAGTAMPKAELIPITGKSKDFHKAKFLIMNTAPVSETPEKLAEENKRMENFIKRSLTEFKSEGVAELREDMTIPIDMVR